MLLTRALIQEIADDFRDFGVAKWPVSKKHYSGYLS
jgi:hypothetical protein